MTVATKKFDLSDATVAILATHGFEQSELFEPKKALDDAGATTRVVSLETGEIKGWKDGDWGDSIEVDLTVARANPVDFSALLLPGGVMNPDALRLNAKAVDFVRDFFVEGKPVAAICHGPWLLIDAGVINGRRVTSWPSIRADLQNAGAIWEDSEVVVDQGLVTSRSPKDLPAFNAKLCEEVAEGVHKLQAVSA